MSKPADNPNHFFIERHDLKVLREVLADLPTLCEDLDDTIAKRARLGGRSFGKRSKAAIPAPINLDAAEVADNLRAVLASWVRLVLEHRGLRFDETVAVAARWQPMTWPPGEEFVGPLQPRTKPPRPRAGFVGPLQPEPAPKRPAFTEVPVPTAGLARWLHRHLIALAMTPGSEMALRDIQDAKRKAENVVCPPSVPWAAPSEQRIAEARRLRLNSHGIAMLAKNLDERYRNLTQRRVDYLRESGKIKPVPGPWAPDWPMLYVLGEVLDAHLQVQIKRRHGKGEAA